jgi:Ni,Fe-hydrogenase III large subunit
MPEGPVCLPRLPEIPAGEAVAKSEAPRGELIYYLRTDGSDKPARLKWRVPSYMNWSALEPMMKGNKIADIPIIVNSIDPCVSCTER